MTTRKFLSLFVDLRPRQALRWSKLRARGRAWFIFVDGLLIAGGCMATVALVAIFFLNRQFKDSTRFPVAVELPELIYRVILPVLGIALLDGLLVGICMWHYMEWAYRRYLEQEAQHACVTARA
jgi:hypothetical protein